MPGAAQGVVRRGLDRLNAQNQLHQIGIFYAVYQAEMGRPPARLEEFLAYIQREAPHEHQSLESGYFVLNLHSRPTSATALAYEKEPSPDGSRLVLMGDCNAVQVLDARGFAEAQKAGEP